MSGPETYMGMTGADIYRAMHANPSGTAKMEAAEEASRFIADGYREIMNDLDSAQEDLNSFWFGASADAASRALKPLSDSALEYMGNLDQAALSMSSMAVGFNGTRPDLRPMEPTRPTNADGLYDTLSWWSTDAEENAAAWDDANKHNIQMYKSYEEYRRLSEDSLVRDYKPVEQMLTGGEPTVHEPDTPAGSANIDIPDAGGSYGGVPGPAYGGYSPPAGGGPAALGGSRTPGPSVPPTATPPAAEWQSDVPSPSDVQPPPSSQSPGSRWEPSWDDDSTSLASYTAYSSGFDSSGGGFGPSGSYSSGSYSGGSYSGGSYSGGSYSGGAYGGGFAPRGGSATPGTPSGSARTTGTAPYSSGGAASRAYTAGTTSSSTSSTTGRAPFMSGAGAGGQDSEDNEHERKVTLPTDDPNSLFGGIPEGTTVVPPVIGE